MKPITTEVRCQDCRHNLILEQTPETNRIRCEILEGGKSGIIYCEDAVVRCREFTEVQP